MAAARPSPLSEPTKRQFLLAAGGERQESPFSNIVISDERLPSPERIVDGRDKNSRTDSQIPQENVMLRSSQGSSGECWLIAFFGLIHRKLLFNQAVGFHHKGNLAEAERLYKKILAAEPLSFEPRHLLGVIRHQQGR